jgi:hypothetical protein
VRHQVSFWQWLYYTQAHQYIHDAIFTQLFHCMWGTATYWYVDRHHNYHITQKHGPFAKKSRILAGTKADRITYALMVDIKPSRDRNIAAGICGILFDCRLGGSKNSGRWQKFWAMTKILGAERHIFIFWVVQLFWVVKCKIFCGYITYPGW